MKNLLFFIISFMFISQLFGATYTWNVNNGSWGASGSWSPARITPANSDILIFDGTTFPTVSALTVPTQQISQLRVINNCTVSISAIAAGTLTISTSGSGLQVDAGSQLIYTGTRGIEINLAGGATGTINGDIVFASGNVPHLLTANAANKITFTSGASFQFAATNDTNNPPFGSTNLNSIVFQSGATYYMAGSKTTPSNGASGDPFGAPSITSPASVVTFQSGSLLYVWDPKNADFSGRTVGNITFDLVNAPAGSMGDRLDFVVLNDCIFKSSSNALISYSGQSPFRIFGDFIVESGSAGFRDNTNLVVNTPIEFKGNLKALGGFVTSSDPQRIYLFDGVSQQTVTLSSNSVLNNLEVNNSSGIVLGTNVAVHFTLYMDNGNINTGTNSLILGLSRTVNGTLNRTSGTIIGKFTRWIGPGLSSPFAFPIGTASFFNEATVKFSSGPSVGGTLTASITNSNPGTNGLPLVDGSVTVVTTSPSGYWTITAGNGITGGTYDLTLETNGFSFIVANNLLRTIKRPSGASPFIVEGTQGTNSGNAVFRTGLTSFSDFAIGEPQALALFYAVPTAGVGPFNVNFFDISPNSPLSWDWDFGDGGTSTAQSPSHIYGTVAAPTTYTVKLFVTNSYSTSSTIKTGYIYVIPPTVPIAGFYGTPLSGYGPLTVNFTDTSAFYPTSWAWDFGDGSVDTVQNPVHVYGVVSALTTYNVQLIITNSAGTSSTINLNYITVTEPPPVGGFFGSPTIGIGPLNVIFTDTSANTPTSWTWDFGDGGSDNVQNPSHNYSAVTVVSTYTVQLIVSSVFGTNTVTKSNYITVLPVLNAGFYGTPTVGLGPLNVNFTDTSNFNPTGWEWDFGDGSTSNTQNPSHTYNAVSSHTTYNVQLIVTNAYATSTIILSNYINILAPLSAGFYGTPTAGNSPLTVSFTDTTLNNPTGWAWDFGDGGTATTQNPQHTYAEVFVPTSYSVQLIATNSYSTSTVVQSNYIVTELALHTGLPDLKLFTDQSLPQAYDIADFLTEGYATTYSIVSNFIGVASINGSVVSQGGFDQSSVGTNVISADGISGSTTLSHLVKYSSYKIQKLPKVGLTAGSSYTLNMVNFTLAKDTSYPLPPVSFGNSGAILNSDTNKVSAVWSGTTAIVITALNSFSGAVNVDVTAAPVPDAPYGLDQDKERIQVYTNMLSNSTFSTANDTTSLGLELAPGRAILATPSWSSGYTDTAGTLANGIWSFAFANSSSGVKATLIPSGYISLSGGQWYISRMRVVADTTNTHQSILFGFSNLVGAGIQTDIAANVVFGAPTVWTWQETPFYLHGNTTSGYPQFQFKAGGQGSIYIDEIQIINAAPTLVDANRGNTRLHYPYGNFDVASDTTGWGQELYGGAGSTPIITVNSGYLRLDFSGAGSGTSQKGIKWTANNGIGGTVYTPTATPTREVGTRMTVTKESGNFNSLIILLAAAYGVQLNGQASIGVPPSNLVASAEIGILVEGDVRTVGRAINGNYQFQFGIRSDLVGVLLIDNVDFDKDSDDPNYGDSALYP